MLKTGPVDHEQAIRFGQRKQLLVDEYILSDFWNVKRMQEEVRKHPSNPVITGDKPWEKWQTDQSFVLPMSALYDADSGMYRLWYFGGNPEVRSGIRYAISKDGVKWEKPDLGLIEFDGDKRNNICRVQPDNRPLFGPLWVVRNAPGHLYRKRFLAFGLCPYHEDGSVSNTWLKSGFSEDGTTWHYYEDEGMRIGGGGGFPSCVWDEDLGRFVLYQRQISERAVSESGKRYITRQVSVDFNTWTPRQTVFNPMDSRWPQVESMMVFLHEGIYFGLPVMLEMELTGYVETHLVTSRDGIHWQRPCPDTAFIPRGPVGEFDDRMAGWAQPLIHGDRYHFVYCGARMPHSSERGPIVDDGSSIGAKEHPHQIGVASIPRDRFFYLRMDEVPGGFLTKPFVVEGDELTINAIVDRELRAELVDPVIELYDAGPKGIDNHYMGVKETTISGYSFKDMKSLAGNNLSHSVAWKGGPIGKLKGKTVRLRVVGRMACIYGFQII